MDSCGGMNQFPRTVLLLAGTSRCRSAGRHDNTDQLTTYTNGLSLSKLTLFDIIK